MALSYIELGLRSPYQRLGHLQSSTYTLAVDDTLSPSYRIPLSRVQIAASLEWRNYRRANHLTNIPRRICDHGPLLQLYFICHCPSSRIAESTISNATVGLNPAALFSSCHYRPSKYFNSGHMLRICQTANRVTCASPPFANTETPVLSSRRG